MTQKERFVDLYVNYYLHEDENKQFWLEDYRVDEYLKPEAEKIADYLLQNGVIAPPCKVGDEVWCIYDGEVRRRTIVMIYRYRDVEFGCVVETDYGVEYTYNEDEFGFKLFLTKEEAEQALAEQALKERNYENSV